MPRRQGHIPIWQAILLGALTGVVLVVLMLVAYHAGQASTNQAATATATVQAPPTTTTERPATATRFTATHVVLPTMTVSAIQTAIPFPTLTPQPTHVVSIKRTPVPLPMPGPTFTVRVEVFPSEVYFNTEAALTAYAPPGAHCRASVGYNSGVSAKPFKTTKKVPKNGIINWLWNEEAITDGGTAQVICVSQGRTEGGSIYFTVFGGGAGAP